MTAQPQSRPQAPNAWRDVGGVAPRVLAARCVAAVDRDGGAPGDWISANVHPAVRAWVACHVSASHRRRARAWAGRARTHQKLTGRDPADWVRANVPERIWAEVVVLLEKAR